MKVFTAKVYGALMMSFILLLFGVLFLNMQVQDSFYLGAGTISVGIMYALYGLFLLYKNLNATNKARG